MMTRWKYVGVRNHIFTYNKNTGYITCSCRTLGTRVSAEQAVPVSERHIRRSVRVMGGLKLEDLTLNT